MKSGGGIGLILGLAVAAAALGGYLQHRGGPAISPVAPPIGRSVAHLSLPGLDGRPHRLTDDRGRRVLLNFWASWCGPCVDEMPMLSRAQQRLGGHAVTVVGIAMDEPGRVRSFLAAHPVDYPILLGRLEPPSTTLSLGDTRELLPYSVLVDTDGRILDAHLGPMSAAQLQRWLNPATPPDG